MAREFFCRYGCGTLLHYDNGHVVDGSNAQHWCPNYRKSQPPKTLQSFDELQREIDLLLEHAINLANQVSQTTTYDITPRPKNRQDSAGTAS